MRCINPRYIYLVIILSVLFFCQLVISNDLLLSDTFKNTSVSVAYTYKIESSNRESIEAFFDEFDGFNGLYSISIARKYIDTTTSVSFSINAFVTDNSTVLIDQGESYDSLVSNQIIVNETLLQNVSSGGILVTSGEDCKLSLLKTTFDVVGIGGEINPIDYEDNYCYLYLSYEDFWNISSKYDSISVAFTDNLSAKDETLLNACISNYFQVESSSVYLYDVVDNQTLIRSFSLVFFLFALYLISNFALFHYFLTSEYREQYVYRILGASRIRVVLKIVSKLFGGILLSILLSVLLFVIFEKKWYLVSIATSKLINYLLISSLLFLIFALIVSLSTLLFIVRRECNNE